MVEEQEGGGEDDALRVRCAEEGGRKTAQLSGSDDESAYVEVVRCHSASHICAHLITLPAALQSKSAGWRAWKRWIHTLNTCPASYPPFCPRALLLIGLKDS